MTTVSKPKKQAISESEQRLVDFVADADEKIGRGKVRIGALHGEIESLEAEIKLAAETLGQQQADAVMSGATMPDTAAIRKEIEERRHKVVELKFEMGAVRDSVAELTQVADPKRQELERIRRRRGADAGEEYFASVIDDALALMPKVAAAAALRAGERVAFFSSPDRAARVLERGIVDKVLFAQQCSAEYKRLQTILKLQ